MQDLLRLADSMFHRTERKKSGSSSKEAGTVIGQLVSLSKQGVQDVADRFKGMSGMPKVCTIVVNYDPSNPNLM